MFGVRTHVIIDSGDKRSDTKIIIKYVKHQSVYVDTNVQMVVSNRDNEICFSLDPKAARYIAKQLLNVADEMENDM